MFLKQFTAVRLEQMVSYNSDLHARQAADGVCTANSQTGPFQ